MEWDKKVDYIYTENSIGEFAVINISTLFSTSLYQFLQEETHKYVPSDRRVFLTMNEYKMSDINPEHSKKEIYSHIIVFSVRFVRKGKFQPLGSIVFPRDKPVKNQALILADMVRMYIITLWKMGLYVVASVSPPTETFKQILKELSKTGNLENYSGTIIYTVEPVKDLIHIYDMKYLVAKFLNVFKSHDIEFFDGTRQVKASWSDVWLILSTLPHLNDLKTQITNEQQEFYSNHVFTQNFLSVLLEYHANGLLPPQSIGTAVLIEGFVTILKYTDLEEVNVKDLIARLPSWIETKDLLVTFLFNKKYGTYTKKNKTSISKIEESKVKRKIDFADEFTENVLSNDGNNINHKTVEVKVIDSSSLKGRRKIVFGDAGALKNSQKENVMPPQKKPERKGKDSSNNDIEKMLEEEERKSFEKYLYSIVPVSKSNDFICGIDYDGNLRPTLEQNLKKASEDKSSQTNSKVLLEKITNISEEQRQAILKEDCEDIPYIIDKLGKIGLITAHQRQILQEDFNEEPLEKNGVINEWLVGINGIMQVVDKLQAHKVRFFRPDCFNIEHIDYFMDVIKKEKNRFPSTDYAGLSYSLVDVDLAYQALECGPDRGCYMVKSE